MSWVRLRDGHILTVDQEVFTADTRVETIITRRTNIWSLRSGDQIRDFLWKS